MSRPLAFPLVDGYLGALLGVDLASVAPGETTVVASRRRLRAEGRYAYVHALWWLWQQDGRSVLSVPPGAAQGVRDALKRRIRDPRPRRGAGVFAARRRGVTNQPRPRFIPSLNLAQPTVLSFWPMMERAPREATGSAYTPTAARTPTQPVPGSERLPPIWNALESEETMKAHVDRNVCIGSGICVSIAPDVYELDDEMKSHVVNPGAATDALYRETAENCPTQAIILEDDDGNQIYP